MPESKKFKLYPEKMTPTLSYGLFILICLIGSSVFYYQWETQEYLYDLTKTRLIPQKERDAKLLHKQGKIRYKNRRYGVSFQYPNSYEVIFNDKGASGELTLVDDRSAGVKLLTIEKVEDQGPSQIPSKKGTEDSDEKVLCDEQITIGELTGHSCSDDKSLDIIFKKNSYQYYWSFVGISTLTNEDKELLESLKMFEPSIQ